MAAFRHLTLSNARRSSSEKARSSMVPRLALGLLVTAAWGCDGTPPAMDASTSTSEHLSAISLRVDALPEKPPTLSVLGFRATFSGVPAADVLGLVDPLSGASPARDCQLRDIDSAAAALAATGKGIELEELSGVGVSMLNAATTIRTSPRLFPDVAPAIGGVVSEAGPIALSDWPALVRVASGDAIGRAFAIPSPGRVTTVNGAAPIANTSVVVTGDLTLGFVAAGAGENTVELRPFGATVALVCRLPASSRPAADPATVETLSFVVARPLLHALVTAAGGASDSPVAASLDVVRRPEGEGAVADTHVAVEARTSILVELHP
jgi:hypothetical protein